jgi:hypothetical protein
MGKGALLFKLGHYQSERLLVTGHLFLQGLKMSVDASRTNGAPSALERYAPSNTSTKEPF